MEFDLNEEQRALARTVRAFSVRELRGGYSQRDRDRSFPRDVWKKLGELGLLGMRVSEEFGGMSTTCVTQGVVAEEIGREDPNVGVAALAVGELVGHMLEHATARAREEFLTPMIKGEKVPAFAVTEPHCGTDAAAMKAKAVKKGDRYVLNGEKSGITLAKAADFVLVYAKTDNTGGAKGVSAFVVPTDAPGITRQFYEDMGARSLVRGSIFMDDVEVPEHCLVGAEGEGFKLMMKGFDASRVYLALSCLGAALISLEETIKYTRERTAFGKPLARFEGVSFPVAEHSAILEATRLLCYKALWLRDQGLAHSKEAAMVKWMGPRFSVDAIRDCLLLHGHYGWTTELPFEQRLRDAMAVEIADGTAQVSKIVIARELYGRDFLPY
ncbi:MAG: acyl-CoA dehydrogenase family protein [Syntrophobacteraceae bacterium]|nr:acyl-CoA dehydrogenase family protein [Syntrophobacteraceae bacterium]